MDGQGMAALSNSVAIAGVRPDGLFARQRPQRTRAGAASDSGRPRSAWVPADPV